ncbi:MAG: hypothetical protein ACNFW9_04900 [Candidatus Kerfeldbacteria bacterium]
MNKNLKIKKNYLVGLLTIGVIIAIIIFVSPKNEVDTNIKLNTNIVNSNTKSILNTESYTFSGGIFELDVESYDDNTQRLKMKNLGDETKRDLGSSIVQGYGEINHQYTGFIWNDNNSRIYFISKNEDRDYITLFYIDSSDYDPYALTEIVYTDINNVFTLSTELIDVENETLTLLVGEDKYLLDISLGVDAIPIKF